MRKLSAGVLCLLTLSVLLSSCALIGKPSDGEIQRVMEEILPASYEATYIVYGPGIEIEKNFAIDPDWTAAHYAPVAADYKYQTEEDVKRLILSAFSKDYALEMYEYAFEGNDEVMSRYGTANGKLTMDVTREAFGMATDIYVETAHVIKGTAYACIVEVEYSADSGKTRRTMELQMVNEDGKWLFDGPTY